jgi:hypothetical protein
MDKKMLKERNSIAANFKTISREKRINVENVKKLSI